MLFSKHQFISADLKWSNQVKYLILITLKGKLPFEWEVFNSLRRDLILQNEDFLIHQYLQNTFCPTYIHTPGLFAFHRKFNMNIHGQFHFFFFLIICLWSWFFSLPFSFICLFAPPSFSAVTSCINWAPSAKVANRCEGSVVFSYCNFLLLKKKLEVSPRSPGGFPD